MITIEIPTFGTMELKYLVSDFTGTLSEGGRLVPGIKERLNTLAGELEIHILTADTFGVVRKELHGVDCMIHILKGEDQNLQKEKFVEALGWKNVVAYGNGNNDRRMLRTARIGVAVCLKEGCSSRAAQKADVLVTSVADGLDLLLHPKRLKATLRY